jgi:hypothetical protein
MRLEPSTETVPENVAKYLLPSERQVISVRAHPAILLPSATSALGGLFAAAAVTPIVEGSRPLDLIIWLLTGFLFLRFLSACFNWFAGYLVITNKRILCISAAHGIRGVRNIPLEDVKKMTLRRSRGSRVLNYGAFIFDTGDGRIVVDYILYPEQLYLEVNGLIFEDRREPPNSTGDSSLPIE